MNPATELADLFRRDITRLLQELQAFPNQDTLWRILPGVTNSAGNLVLHLEGNLRDFIGRQLGGVPYHRERELEFAPSSKTTEDLIQSVTELIELIPNVISALSWTELQAVYPQEIFGAPLTTFQFVIHLQGHLNYHLGQIDYLRRILNGGTAVQFTGL